MFGFSKKSEEEKKNKSEEEEVNDPENQDKDHKKDIEENVEFYKMPRGVKLGRPAKKQEKQDKQDKKKDKGDAKKKEKKGSKIQAVAQEDKASTGGTDSKTKLIGAIIIGGGIIVMAGVVYLGYVYFIAPSISPSDPESSQEQEKEYKLTVNIEGQGSTDPAGGVYKQGSQIQIKAEPDQGWEFKGFSGACSGAQCQLTMSRDRQITVRFKKKEPQTYSLMVEVKGQGSADPSGQTTHNKGDQVTVKAQAQEGWELDGFSGACNGSDCQLIMDKNKRVTVNFQKKE